VGGDAIKIAAQADGLRDALRILDTARGSRRVVAVPMGDAAAAARILALRSGSALAYAPIGAASAPGQISLEQMTSLFRADHLTRCTRVYAVIGDPIAHSLSPQLQNAGFRARGIDAVYVPVLVRDLRDFLAAIGPLAIAGFSVTLPHKEAILRHLDDCDPLAAEIGAVNTVVVRGGGKLYGYNTDYVGVLRALERRLPLRGSSVLVLGAGGSARAVAFALARAGANTRICARRLEKARALARAVGGEAIERTRLRSEFFDAIINTTPVGMFPRTSESPLEARELNCRLVFDLIYRPQTTRLLQLAARRGIETVSGLEMFVAQGTAQWEIWTGQRAPVKEMAAAVAEVE
jgi:3-dehydroquinate dehydratase / shikimate dehydrogenase